MLDSTLEVLAMLMNDYDKSYPGATPFERGFYEYSITSALNDLERLDVSLLTT